jgi:ferredoxin
MNHEKNVEGLWSVNEDCVGCGVCYSGAPEFFGEDESGNAFIQKQPKDFNEEELCFEQMDACPVSAIKNGPIDTRL